MKAVYIYFDDENVRIPFTDFDQGLFNQLKKSKMGNWDNDGQQYQIPRTKYNYDTLKAILDEKIYIEVEKEKDNPVVVHRFISEGQTFTNETETVADATPESYLGTANYPPPKSYPGMETKADDLPDCFTEYWREKLKTEMGALKLSPHTRAAYTNANAALCRWLQKTPEAVMTDDVKRYLAYLDKHKDYAASTINANLSAFKFFYGTVMKRDVAKDQRRPREDKILPKVLTKAEISALFEGERNKKHCLLLKFAYGSGLRVSEVVKLRQQDIDLSNKTLFLVKSKGRRDRKTIISQKVIEELEEYYKQYDISDWIFPGADPADHLAIRSAQYVFKHALKKAKIRKNASIHSLRHSFATHLLESGYDIVRIRDLLGHSSVRTTERYLQVAVTSTLKVTSPLDTLDENYDVAVDFRPENRDFYDKNARWKR